MSAATTAWDGRQLDRMDQYAKRWQKDLKKDTKVCVSVLVPSCMVDGKR